MYGIISLVMTPRVWIVLLGATLAAPMSGTAQSAVVRGIVRDPESGAPVVGARVALGSWLGAWTGPDGRFSFSAPHGRFMPVIDCSRRHDNPLAAGADSLTVSDQNADLDLALAHGRECLAPMSATSYGEFRGVLFAEGNGRLLRLCDGPDYRIAIDCPAKVWRDLVFRATRSVDARRPDLVLMVRGRLNGPGFYGRDGSAGYLIEVEKVTSLQKRAAIEACR